VTDLLPKASKINTDGNNTVQAPELSLGETEAEYLASSPKSVVEDVVVGAAALPGKKPNEARNLANELSSSDASRRTNGADSASRSALNVNAIRPKDDAAKSKSEETVTTLLKETIVGEAHSGNDRDEKAIPRTDVKPRGASNNDAAETMTWDQRRERIIGKNVIKGDGGETEAVAVSSEASRVAGGTIAKDSAKDSRRRFDPKSKAAIKHSGAGPDSGPSKVTPSLPLVTSGGDISGGESANARSLSSSLSSSKMSKREILSIEIPNKETEERKPNHKVTVTLESRKEVDGRLSKSASAESIDFWNEIKAPGSPEIARSTEQRSGGTLSREATRVPAGTTAEAEHSRSRSLSAENPKRILGDPEDRSANGGSRLGTKEHDGRGNNEAVVESSNAALESVDKVDSIGEDRPAGTKRARITRDNARLEAEIDRGANEIGGKEAEKATVRVKEPPKRKKKKKKRKSDLSIAIDIGGEPNRTVKRVSPKRENVGIATLDSSSTPGDATTAVALDGAFAPTSGQSRPPVSVPLINIIEAAKLPADELDEPENRKAPKAEGSDDDDDDDEDDEEHEDPGTPTNELLPEPSSSRTMICSKWSNRHDSTSTDDVETPLASEEVSLAASPIVTPRSSKTRRRAVGRKKPSAANSSERKESEGPAVPTSDDPPPFSKTSLADKRLSPKPSPMTSPCSGSPRNRSPSRPLDLMRMFYTTPSALLTATPRDLSKVKRAKIKRKRHRSRTPSVSSDSTGSTTSTATTASTDGSGSTCTELDDDPEHKRMNSTRSNDSGFDGSPRISSTLSVRSVRCPCVATYQILHHCQTLSQSRDFPLVCVSFISFIINRFYLDSICRLKVPGSAV